MAVMLPSGGKFDFKNGKKAKATSLDVPHILKIFCLSLTIPYVVESNTV